MNDLLLVGSGVMAVEYARVLQRMGRTATVVGRGEATAKTFEEKTGWPVVRGGLEAYLARGSAVGATAIVAVGVETLELATATLIEAGVRSILVEKPGALDLAGLRSLQSRANVAGAQVFVGYNRRFYSSVQKAKELIAEDGDVVSFQFEFTEWSHTIGPLTKGPGVKENWFLANSSHVVDLAFFLGGIPTTLFPLVRGSLPWHPAGASFSGAGETAPGVLFSYHANWQAPGRWGVELQTRSRRFILRPLEKLEVIKIGTVKSESVPLDDALDLELKPGLYRQVDAFLAGSSDLCSLAEQVATTENVYNKIAGYGR